MVRLWIVLIWFISVGFAAKIVPPTHGNPKQPNSVPHDSGSGARGSPPRTRPSPSPVDSPGLTPSPAAYRPHQAGSSQNAPSTGATQNDPYAKWDKSRSGLVLPSRAPTVGQILSELNQFWTGSPEKEAVRRNLVFWVGKKRMIPNSGGYSYSLDSNSQQSIDFTNNITTNDRTFYNLNMLRGAYAQTWTDDKLEWYEQEAMFDRLSAAMALFARDEAIVFGCPEAFARDKTAWSDIESKILRENGVKITWYVVKDGKAVPSGRQPDFEGNVFVAPPPPGKKSPVLPPPVSRPFQRKYRIRRPRIEETGPLRDDDKPVQSTQSETQASQDPRVPSTSQGGRQPKQKPTGAAQGTYPFRPSPATSQGGKTPKQEPQNPESSHPEQSEPQEAKPPSASEPQTGEPQQSERQPQTQPPSEPGNPVREPFEISPAQREPMSSSQGQSGSRGGRTGRGNRSGARGGGGGGSRGGRKANPKPRAAKFAANVGQTALYRPFSPYDPQSVGMADIRPNVMIEDFPYAAVDEDESEYDKLPYRALDDMYLSLMFSEMDIAEDPLYDQSDLARLMGDLGVPLTGLLF